MAQIMAQVSIYPLREKEIGPAIEKAWDIFTRHGLDIHPGPMSTRIVGDENTVFAALQDVLHTTGSGTDMVMVATFSNACPESSEATTQGDQPATESTESVSYRPIGIVRNRFDASSRGDEMRAGSSKIVLRPDLTGGLEGLTPGEQIMVLFYFDRSEEYALLQHPRGNQERPQRGVFTLRSPHRPNPIGATVVEVLSIQDNVLTVHGLDAYNGTPVLDLKPV
ncbi:MAG: tRNA (N6-threonylcarbamoyladenosine(37)-N6)-methyltransferase TrmO [Anaerolineales bacterium]